jgi:elongation factor Ts
VAISAAAVKQLRDASGAGMMDCKKALAECGGDVEVAKEFLRKKGLASADKKAGRVAAEGAVGAYIHAGARLGVLVEVNCETDFVARGDKFKELVNDIAMQIAACPAVTVVSENDVSAETLAKEREIEMGKEDLASKPEAIRAKIVDGRVAKIAKELALLEQPFIKDTNKTVAEHIKESVAAIGENIQVRRFGRFVLGEGLEKRSEDFAAEVAAQTGGIV